jgi:hypothetical protein
VVRAESLQKGGDWAVAMRHAHAPEWAKFFDK